MKRHLPSPLVFRSALVALAYWCWLAGAPAPAVVRAQPAPSGALPGSPSPSVLSASPGMRLGSAQVPVVGGNSAGARERALDEALRQTVDLALGELLDAPTRVTQAKAIRTLMARARSYVKRYRTLEEGESGGSYLMRVEAEIDEAALRRATDRWSSPAAPPVAPARASALSLLVISSGAPEAGAALVAALVAVGIGAELGDASLMEPARALQAAARKALGGVAFVSAAITDEGAVRGPGKEAVSCHLSARVVSAPRGQLISEPSAVPRVFVDHPTAGRTECLSRAASEIAGQLVTLASSSSVASANLRAVTVDAAVTEPAAVPALLKSLRGLGAVSAAELRRLSSGHAEIKVQTRITSAALVAALARESTTSLELAGVEAGADTLRLQVRLRPPTVAVPNAAGSVPASPTP